MLLATETGINCPYGYSLEGKDLLTGNMIFASLHSP
jgi:hypothetical protein